MTKEEAIVILDGFKHNPLFNEQHFEAFDMAISALSEKKGEWIKIQSGDKDFPESIVCSVCGGENSYLDFGIGTEPIAKSFVKSKYCPNCGARMKGGE